MPLLPAILDTALASALSNSGGRGFLLPSLLSHGGSDGSRGAHHSFDLLGIALTSTNRGFSSKAGATVASGAVFQAAEAATIADSVPLNHSDFLFGGGSPTLLASRGPWKAASASPTTEAAGNSSPETGHLAGPAKPRDRRLGVPRTFPLALSMVPPAGPGERPSLAREGEGEGHEPTQDLSGAEDERLDDWMRSYRLRPLGKFMFAMDICMQLLEGYGVLLGLSNPACSLWVLRFSFVAGLYITCLNIGYYIGQRQMYNGFKVGCLFCGANIYIIWGFLTLLLSFSSSMCPSAYYILGSSLAWSLLGISLVEVGRLPRPGAGAVRYAGARRQQ